MPKGQYSPRTARAVQSLLTAARQDWHYYQIATNLTQGLCKAMAPKAQKPSFLRKASRMPVAAVNILADKAFPPPDLTHLLAGLPEKAPIVFMLHGYRYDPGTPATDPHTDILSLTPRPESLRAPSWPRKLGFGTDQPEEGLAIAIGWNACGTLRQAYENAATVGQTLAALISRIRHIHSGPIGLIGHSLGARVAMMTLPHLRPHAVQRIIALAGAEFHSTARAMLQTHAGRQVQMLNVTSAENMVFDLMFSALLARHGGFRPTLSRCPDLPNCVTLRINKASHRAGLANLGYRTKARRALVCHWSAYLRPGLFPIYKAFLTTPQALPLDLLQLALSKPHHNRSFSACNSLLNFTRNTCANPSHDHPLP
jgi:pimeloyl-ACP methyl ester carboxylesterase